VVLLEKGKNLALTSHHKVALAVADLGGSAPAPTEA